MQAVDRPDAGMPHARANSISYEEHDLGMCCAFNSVKAMKAIQFSELVTAMQSSTEYGGKGKIEKERQRATVGMSKGLRLTMDLHSDSESFGTVATDYSAFRVLVTEPGDFPLMKQSSLVVEPGRETFLALSGQYFSSDGIEYIHPHDRNCYFSHEGNLSFHENYTFSNCLLECALQQAENLVGCVPWFMPQNSSSAMCDPWMEKTFMTEFDNFNENDCNDCLPDCEAQKTSVVASSAKFRFLKYHFFLKIYFLGCATPQT